MQTKRLGRTELPAAHRGHRHGFCRNPHTEPDSRRICWRAQPQVDPRTGHADTWLRRLMPAALFLIPPRFMAAVSAKRLIGEALLQRPAGQRPNRHLAPKLVEPTTDYDFSFDGVQSAASSPAWSAWALERHAISSTSMTPWGSQWTSCSSPMQGALGALRHLQQQGLSSDHIGTASNDPATNLGLHQNGRIRLPRSSPIPGV